MLLCSLNLINMDCICVNYTVGNTERVEVTQLIDVRLRTVTLDLAFKIRIWVLYFFFHPSRLISADSKSSRKTNPYRELHRF